MIKIKCPKCEKLLGIDDSKAGGIGACPTCGQKFKIPGSSVPTKSSPGRPAAAAPKKAAETKGSAPPTPKPVAAKPKRFGHEDDDFNPYAVKEEPESTAGPPEDDRVDQMVKDDWRKRKRERAWDKVGVPTKIMKVVALIGVGLELLFFFFVLIDVVLYVFKVDQGEKGVRMLLFDIGPANQQPAGLVLLFCFIGLVIALTIYGFIIAGAEKMKKLESYGFAMAGCILAIIFGGGLLTTGGILGLMTLFDKTVKLQFPTYRRELQEEEDAEWEELEEERRVQKEEEDEEMEAAAREGRPMRHRRRRHKEQVDKKSLGEKLGGFGVTLIMLGILWLMILIFSIFQPQIGLFLMLGMGLILIAGGHLWIMFVAFTDSALWGVLILVIGWPVDFIYLFINFPESWKPALLQGVGAIFFLLIGMVFAAVMMGVQGVAAGN